MLGEKIKALEARLTELAQQEYGIERDTVAAATARIDSVINTTLEALAEMRTALGNSNEVAGAEKNLCYAEVRVPELAVRGGMDVNAVVRRELTHRLAGFINNQKMNIQERYILNTDEKVYRAQVYVFTPEELQRYTAGRAWFRGYDDYQQTPQVRPEFRPEVIAQEMFRQMSRAERRGQQEHQREESYFDKYRKGK